LARLRKTLRGRNAPRLARSLGIGGAAGLGSIAYALTVISKSLRDDALLADAQAVAEQFTDDLIAADQRLDVIGGSAGAILGLLRLHRDTGSAEVLGRALKPRGVGVLVRATHHCMTARGVHKPEADLVTSRMIGCLRDHSELRQEFLSMTV
jgi:hypothetical protein